MKKSIKMLLMVFAVAFGVLLVSGSTSKAATTWNAEIKQTNQDKNQVVISWSPYIGAEEFSYYDIYIGDSANNVVSPKGRVYSRTTATISGLAAGKVYYVRIEAVDSTGKEVVAASDPVATIVTVPDVPKVSGLKQTDASNNSITMSWNAVAGATSYDVYRYNGYNDFTKVGADVQATSYKDTTGLQTNMEIRYFVLAKQAVAGTSIVGQSEMPFYTSELVTMRTMSAKVSLLAITNYWSSLNEAVYGWSQMNAVSGYQFELKYGKKKLTKEVTSTSISLKPFPKSVFVKARVRAYITVDGKKKYGAWSSYKYDAATKKLTVTRSANRKKITVKWKKVTGATGYKVSIATKSDGTYKKVKTLSKKKSSITITKYGKKKLKKNKRYYVKVEYLTKSGKKTVTSQISTGNVNGI